MAEAIDDKLLRLIEMTDDVTEGPVRRLAALLDHDRAHWPEGELPPLGHWLFGLPDARQSILGADGHPLRDRSAPTIALPRRMWAGGRVRFLSPIAFGARFHRRTTIRSVAEKKAGAIIVLTLRHEITADTMLASRKSKIWSISRSRPVPRPGRSIYQGQKRLVPSVRMRPGCL